MLEIMAEHGEPRREFLKTCLTSLAGITMISALAPLIDGCSNPTATIDTSYSGTFNVASLTTDNTGMLTSANGADGKPIVIIRNSATSFTALSSRCPHESCVVNPPANNRITCDCHGSQFDLVGNVVRGPATSALYHYKTSYDATTKTLTITAA